MFSPSADESVRSDHWADTFIKYNSPATGFRRPKKIFPKKERKKKKKEIFEIFVRDPIRAKSFEYVTVIKYLAPFASCFRFVVVPWLIVSKIWVSIVGLAGQSGFFHFPWSGNFVSLLMGTNWLCWGPSRLSGRFVFIHVTSSSMLIQSGPVTGAAAAAASILFSFPSSLFSSSSTASPQTFLQSSSSFFPVCVPDEPKMGGI